MDSVEITLARIEERVNTVLQNQAAMTGHVERACSLIAANETKIAVNTNRLDRIEPRVFNGRVPPGRPGGWYVPRWTIVTVLAIIILALGGALTLDLNQAKRVVEVARAAKEALPLSQ